MDEPSWSIDWASSHWGCMVLFEKFECWSTLFNKWKWTTTIVINEGQNKKHVYKDGTRRTIRLIGASIKWAFISNSFIAILWISFLGPVRVPRDSWFILVTVVFQKNICEYQNLQRSLRMFKPLVLATLSVRRNPTELSSLDQYGHKYFSEPQLYHWEFLLFLLVEIRLTQICYCGLAKVDNFRAFF